MPRGRSKVYYVSDLVTGFDSTGATAFMGFVMEIPDDLVAQAGLGWNSTPPALMPSGIRLPKRIRPRHMVGVDSAGHRVRAIVARTAATDWANPAATWTFVDNNGTVQTATVTGFVGEAATR
jgi:hypothetical protein